MFIKHRLSFQRRSFMTYIVRELMYKSIQQIQNEMPDRFEILFEDGIALTSTKRKLIYSWYFWELHRQYPNTRLTSRHHVDEVLKGELLTSSTHRNLLSIIYEDLVKSNNLNDAQQTEHVLKLVYDITNNLYNDIAEMSEAHVNT